MDIIVPKKKYAANYGQPMLYYIPEWDDRVDPEYDFINDKHTEGRNPYLHDVYAHQIYDKKIYDGVLLSKVNAEKTKPKRDRIKKKGVHKFLRYSENKPIMGDCGAFSYIDETEPPYETKEILDYYEDLGFDYGVSIDHLIVGKYGKDKVERDKRYKLTIDNAEDFIKKHREGNYTFNPIGIAQGWDGDSYREAANNLINMGYKYIALGGLAKAKTEEIISILRNVFPIIPDYLKVHLFGVSRLDSVRDFRKLGVTSFDSASYLRKAWLSSSSNYISMDNIKYAAIRIPQVGSRGRKINKLIESGLGTKEEFERLEQNSLMALRKYDCGEIKFKEAHRVVMKYEKKVQELSGKLKAKEGLEKLNININDMYVRIIKLYDKLQKAKLFKENLIENIDIDLDNIYDKIVLMYKIVSRFDDKSEVKRKLKDNKDLDYEELKKVQKQLKKYGKAKRMLEKHAKKYKKVLKEKPWQKCDCKICNNISIETIIFRGNNRNRRRGFHNTYVFYNQFKHLTNEI